jgi:biotin carboxyl carrier protein
MDLTQLKQILDLVREHDLSEFEVEQDGMRLKIRKNPVASGSAPATPPPGDPLLPASPVAAGPAPAAKAAAAPMGQEAPEGAEIELAVVKSPIVVTFYRAS